MIELDPKLLTTFTMFEVHDPADMDVDSRITRRFPRYNNANTYRLRNRALQRDRPIGRLSRLGTRREGDLVVGFIEDQFGTEVGIVGDGHARYCLTHMLAGGIELVGGVSKPVLASGAGGLVYRGDPGLRFLTSDTRLTVWVEATRMHRALAALLDDGLHVPLAFEPSLDWSATHVARLRRLVTLLIEELADPAGMATDAVALASFTDMLVQTTLACLPHNYTDRLGSPAAAAPRQVRRAEEFMRSHANQPITMPDVGLAAGCSTRALHSAFRRFRGTTPLAALHHIRLDLARRALLQPDDPASIRSIARSFGFTNPARFRAAYLGRFGETPAQTRDAAGK
jgi:AraC-like DNA-binding protein